MKAQLENFQQYVRRASNFRPWQRKLPCTSVRCDRYDLVSHHPQMTALEEVYKWNHSMARCERNLNWEWYFAWYHNPYVTSLRSGNIYPSLLIFNFCVYKRNDWQFAFRKFFQICANTFFEMFLELAESTFQNHSFCYFPVGFCSLCDWSQRLLN